MINKDKYFVVSPDEHIMVLKDLEDSCTGVRIGFHGQGMSVELVTVANAAIPNYKEISNNDSRDWLIKKIEEFAEMIEKETGVKGPSFIC